MSFLLGKKLRMSQVWEGDNVTPVTFIKALPNTVSQVRTKDKDGYEAVQVLLGSGKNKGAKREFRIDKSVSKKEEKSETVAPVMGETITVEAFKPGDLVRVSGLSKGRGFQGVVKRHGFHGGPQTHGQKNRLRAPGSIGSTAPQRVVPGRRMAGRMGNERITVKNLRVVAVDLAANTLAVKGAVPGALGALLEIQTK